MTSWKPVRGYGGAYLVSDEGEVWSEHRQRCLTPSEDRSGYLTVLLSKGGSTRRHFVHVLVMQAFGARKPSSRYEVAHCDGYNQNNAIENLQWKTKKQNAVDRQDHGTENIGENNPRSKLTTSDVARIRRLYEAGERTQQDIADEYGVSRAQISHIIRGKRWRHL